MRKHFQYVIAALCAMALSMTALAQSTEFSFGVIVPPLKGTVDEPALRNIIAESDNENLAFIVANGIKSSSEPCSDALYQRRKDMLNRAKNGLIVSPAGSDWIACKNAQKRTASIERLNRLRELFFNDEFSLGASKIPLIRQSATAKFRIYAENTRWEINNILFATINLPASNNHFLTEAGRNSEFEDRLVANRDWLQRIFNIAERKKFAGLVLFCDGDPMTKPGITEFFDFGSKRDGFSEIRKHIAAQAAKFSGRVLIIHGQNDSADKASNTSSSEGIIWKNKLGDLTLGSAWVTVSVDTSNPTLFTLDSDATDTSNEQQ